jgi:hypothetical protein
MSTDLALASDPSIVERAADPGEYIIQCCERGKWWLEAALARDDLEAVLEAKAQAEAIRIYTVSKGYGVDAKMSAEDIIRRAERGLAIATRNGQRDGVVKTQRDGGWSAHLHLTDEKKKSPGDYVGNGQARVDAYAMADDVTDEEFEEILSEAKSEGNLSRANVARKIRTRKPSPALAPRSGNGHGRRKPHSDTLTHCVLQLQGTVERLALELSGGLDESVTPSLADSWADDLTKVIRPLSRLRIQLKEKASG